MVEAVPEDVANAINAELSKRLAQKRELRVQRDRHGTDTNGTHLSGGSVALAVGDFLELAARFGEQLVGLGASFFSPGLLPSRS